MSVFNAFRSGGRVNKGGYFDFEDEFGQDPIRTRYANTSLAQSDSDTRVRLAASEAQLAKASLEAMTEPARQAADFFGNLEKTARVKDDMMRRARISAKSTGLREQIDQVKDYNSLLALRTDPDNAEALQDSPELKAIYDSKTTAVMSAGLAGLKLDLSRAMSRAEADDAVMRYSYLVGEPEADKIINTYTPLAERRGASIKGLQEKGVQQMPITRGGGLDVDRAETALSGGYTREDVSTYRTILSNLNAQRANIFDPESPEAKELDSQIQSVSSQLLAAGSQSTQQAARAQLELQSLGGGVPEDQDAEFDSLIFGGGRPAKTGQPASSSQSPPAEPSAVETTPQRTVPAETPKPPREADIKRQEEQDKVSEQRGRAARDVETLSEEQARLFKSGYKFSPDKGQQELYGRVDTAVEEARTEDARIRRDRIKQIDARLKQIGSFPANPQLREEATALTEEKRSLTEVKIF
jgi:hypothetical protein